MRWRTWRGAFVEGVVMGKRKLEAAREKYFYKCCACGWWGRGKVAYALLQMDVIWAMRALV